MGMEMSAHVLAGKTEDGLDFYDFAPVEPFINASIVALECYKSPTFRLTMPIRTILVDVLDVSFENSYIDFTEEQAIAACEKLKSEERFHLVINRSLNAELYRGLIEFFEICIANKFSISAA